MIPCAGIASTSGERRLKKKRAARPLGSILLPASADL
jgi:hypothetical protein